MSDDLSDFLKSSGADDSNDNDGSFTVNPEKMTERFEGVILQRNHGFVCLMMAIGLLSPEQGIGEFNFKWKGRDFEIKPAQALDFGDLSGLDQHRAVDTPQSPKRYLHFLALAVFGILRDGAKSVTLGSYRFSKGKDPEVVEAQPGLCTVTYSWWESVRKSPLRKRIAEIGALIQERFSIISVQKGKVGCLWCGPQTGDRLFEIVTLTDGSQVKLSLNIAREFGAKREIHHYCCGVYVGGLKNIIPDGVNVSIDSPELRLDASRTQAVERAVIAEEVQRRLYQRIIALTDDFFRFGFDRHWEQLAGAWDVYIWLLKEEQLSSEQEQALARFRRAQWIWIQSDSGPQVVSYNDCIGKDVRLTEPESMVMGGLPQGFSETIFKNEEAYFQLFEQEDQQRLVKESLRQLALAINCEPQGDSAKMARYSINHSCSDWVEFDFLGKTMRQSVGGELTEIEVSKVFLECEDENADLKEKKITWLQLSDLKGQTLTYRGYESKYYEDKNPWPSGIDSSRWHIEQIISKYQAAGDIEFQKVSRNV